MRPEGQKIVQNIGIAVGILGGGLGMAVAIAAAPLFGSILSLFFIVLFGYIFGGQYLKDRKRKQLLESGIQANGKIIEMWDTGWTMNNQPKIGMVIEVTPRTGMPFKSEISLVISRLQTSYYQVGANCVVRYDPNNQKNVAIESLGGSSEYDVAGLKGNSYFPDKTNQQIDDFVLALNLETKRIIKVGIECKAIIKSIKNTNVFVNGINPINSLVLEVMPDDQPAYEAKCINLIMPASIQKFQPGKLVWIKYDPVDKTKITICHS